VIGRENVRLLEPNELGAWKKHYSNVEDMRPPNVSAFPRLVTQHHTPATFRSQITSTNDITYGLLSRSFRAYRCHGIARPCCDMCPERLLPRFATVPRGFRSLRNRLLDVAWEVEVPDILEERNS
jgi:hypothetical protein